MRPIQFRNPAYAILLIIILVSIARSETLLVPQNHPTIAAGIGAATAGDTVLVAPGYYLEHDLALSGGITLLGGGDGPDSVVIDAQGLGRVLASISPEGEIRIEGLTLTGGLATQETTGWHKGGGLLLRSADAVVAHCILVDNEAEVEGGGISCESGGAVWIMDCEIRGNRAVDGAGVSCNRSSPRLERCLLVDNDALVWGGALFCHLEANPHLISCTLSRNDAHQGAGVWALGSPDIVIEDSIISHGTQGEGLFAYDNPHFPSFITLSCCNVYSNAAGGFGGTLEDQIGIEGNIAADPLFCDLSLADYQLDEASPCLPLNNECGVRIGALGQGCSSLSAVPEGKLVAAADTHPNPFNPSTVISFTLGGDDPVFLDIFDIRGGWVARLLEGVTLEAGDHGIPWNGRGGQGQALPSGIYLYRLRVGQDIMTGKMTLAR